MSKIDTELDGLQFEEQSNSAYATAELLFMASDGDCAKARRIYEEWLRKHHEAAQQLSFFTPELDSALDAIEHSEGQVRPKTTVWDLVEAIESSD